MLETCGRAGHLGTDGGTDRTRHAGAGAHPNGHGGAYADKPCSLSEPSIGSRDISHSTRRCKKRRRLSASGYVWNSWTLPSKASVAFRLGFGIEGQHAFHLRRSQQALIRKVTSTRSSPVARSAMTRSKTERNKTGIRSMTRCFSTRKA